MTLLPYTPQEVVRQRLVAALAVLERPPGCPEWDAFGLVLRRAVSESGVAAVLAGMSALAAGAITELATVRGEPPERVVGAFLSVAR